MMSLERFDPRRVGLVGGVALLALAVGLGVISTVSFGQRHYLAQLEHTAGLRAGESVQVAGVTVGEVRGVSLKGRQVEVEFTVDEDIRLGGDSTAAVKVLTLLGTHYLEVTPLGEGALEDDRIPLARTSVPYNLQDVIEATGTSLEELDSDTVATSLTVVADALRGTPDAARRAVDGVAALSQVAADRSTQMRQLLASARTVTGRLAANRDDIIELMESSNQILAELVRRRDVIHQMLLDSRRLATTITSVLDDNDAALDTLMTNFTSTLDMLQQQDADLTASITGLADLSRYFSNATGNGPWLDLKVASLIPDNTTCINPSGDCR